MEQKKRIIIVGGGVAGMAAGIYAQKAGFESLILERHTILGGECTGWDRQGYHIDNCIHWMTGTNPKKDLHKVWEEVGALGPDVKVIQNDAFVRIDGEDGRQFHVWRDLKHLREDALQLAPEDKDLINEFVDALDRYQDVEIPIKPTEELKWCDIVRLIWRMHRVGRVRKNFLHRTIQDYANQFRSPILRDAILTYLPNGYYAEAVMFMYAMFVSGNAGIPAGGSRKMAERMEQRYRDLGGQVRTAADVEHIEVQDGLATGVRLKNGEVLNCDFVVTACDARMTYERLFDTQYQDPYFKSRYEDTKTFPVFSNFNVYLASDVRKPDLSDMVSWKAEPFEIAGQPHKLIVFKNYQYEPDFAPEGHMITQVLINQYEEDFDWWKALRERDVKAYRAEKLRTAEVIRERIEAHFPDLRGHLKVVEVLTPYSFYRFVGAYKGAYMSFIRTHYRPKMEAHQGRVPGVRNAYMAGQWLQAPGGLPNAVVTGKFAIERIQKDHGL